MSRLTDIATEAFAARLLPAFHEITLPAMQAFGEPPPIAMAMAAAGALAASVLLYSIGIGLRRLPEKVSTESQQERIERMRVVAHHWLPWLLILSPTPVGGMLIVAAGFFAVRPWLAALAVVVAEILWRISPLL